MGGKGGGRVNAFEWTTGVYATAMTLAKNMSQEDLTRTALLFTQLGTTLATMAALQSLDSGGGAVAAADLSDLR